MEQEAQQEACPRWRPWSREAPRVPTPCRLDTLLDRIQKAHREDLRRYTVGHLNPGRLFRPPEAVGQYWDNASVPRLRGEVRRRAERPSSRRVARMRDALAYFTIHTALSPSEAPGSRLYRLLHLPPPPDEEEKGDLQPQAPREAASPQPAPGRPREELRLPDLRVLRPRPPESSRQCALGAARRDEYCYLSSYLGGLTRADRYGAFLRFRRDVLAGRALLHQGLAGRQVGLAHQRKLEQMLQKVCLCDHSCLNQLQVFAEVFEDICNTSLIFGDILREIKDEYELYMAILLHSQPGNTYKTLLSQAECLKQRPVKTEAITQAREELQALTKKMQEALTRNDMLRDQLETEQELLQDAKKQSELSEENAKENLTLIQKVEKKRCEIHNKWDEIQALKNEMKTTLIHREVLHITENAIKSVETDTLKLETANRILRKNINISEGYIKQTLEKNRILGLELLNLQKFIQEFTSFEDPGSHCREQEENEQENSAEQTWSCS